MDHPPLLPPGIHDVSTADLNNHFLSAFAQSSTRRGLIDGLQLFIGELRQIPVTFEMWLDGSFVTEKLDPNDIDLVVFADPFALNTLDSQNQSKLTGLFDRQTSRSIFGCDVLFSPLGDENMRSYWRGWYGFDRNENPKGLARIVVTP